MMKYLLILAVTWLVWRILIRPTLRRPSPTRRPHAASATAHVGPDAHRQQAPPRMVACAHCQLHLPVGDTITEVVTSAASTSDAVPALHFCCEAHRQLYRRAGH